MKKITLLLSIVVCSFTSNAQFYKAVVPAPGFDAALTKIVIDWRNDFKKIEGEQLTDQDQSTVFKSTVSLPGASQCIIYRYRSEMDTSSSWQAVMYEGDDYKAALKVYKNTFHLVRKSRITWIDGSTAFFVGKMETPDENVRFSSSSLQLDVSDPRYNRFFAEVEMVNNLTGWTVHLNFFAKKDDQEKF